MSSIKYILDNYENVNEKLHNVPYDELPEALFSLFESHNKLREFVAIEAKKTVGT